jgi:hypothetical protein
MSLRQLPELPGDGVKLCRDAGLDPMALKGKRILVRGFIDGNVHPIIAINFPEQIELLPRKK